MNETIGMLKCAIQTWALHYRAWYIWPGPQHVRGLQLAMIRRDMVLLAALYRVEQRKATA